MNEKKRKEQIAESLRELVRAYSRPVRPLVPRTPGQVEQHGRDRLR